MGDHNKPFFGGLQIVEHILWIKGCLTELECERDRYLSKKRDLRWETFIFLQLINNLPLVNLIEKNLFFSHFEYLLSDAKIVSQ